MLKAKTKNLTTGNRQRGKVVLPLLVALAAVGAGLYAWVSQPQGYTRVDYVKQAEQEALKRPLFQAPGEAEMAKHPDADLIKYGKELVANTSMYLGPQGKVARITNGMNCQNCHLAAGTKPWGNNYGGVAANYPKYRDRSGTVEGIPKRVNDCIQRSLNGTALQPDSREMKAFEAYIKFVGEKVPKNETQNGVGIWKVAYLDRAADPKAGKALFQQKCMSCHGAEGQGVPKPDGSGYVYPPLWGEHSYNTGAGIYRLSRMAGYIKANMPFGVNFDKPQLTDEQAWDLAAFINSMPRPVKDLSQDWPKIAAKPVDHPFGPYADTFSEEQHKYGPFKPIIAYRKEHFQPVK